MAAEFMGLGVTGILMASLIAPAVVGMLIGSVCKSLKMANISASFCAVSCIVGMLVYVYWLLNGDLIGTLTINSPLGAYAIKIDCMTALMLSISSAVFFLITIHVVKSVSDSGCRYCTLLNALYVAVAMCMIADSVILLLIAWETITAVTYLMCRGHDNEAERRLFFIITHIGGLILICVYLYLWSVTGTPIMSQWSNLQATIGTGAASLAIAGIVLGFGTKLGLVPFHAWTPGLYGTSPTHTVALLSTVC